MSNAKWESAHHDLAVENIDACLVILHVKNAYHDVAKVLLDPRAFFVDQSYFVFLFLSVSALVALTCRLFGSRSRPRSPQKKITAKPTESLC